MVPRPQGCDILWQWQSCSQATTSSSQVCPFRCQLYMPYDWCFSPNVGLVLICVLRRQYADQAELLQHGLMLSCRQKHKTAVTLQDVITISDSEASNEDFADDGKSTEPRTQHIPNQSGRVSSDSNQMPFDVMLTCYTLFERDSVDQQADRSFLKKWHWSHLVLDEAHAVKNASGMRTKRLTRYAAQSIRQRRISQP